MDKQIDEIASTSTILDGDLNRVAVSLLHPNDFIAQPCALTEGRYTIWNDEVRDRFHQVYINIFTRSHTHTHTDTHTHTGTHTRTHTQYTVNNTHLYLFLFSPFFSILRWKDKAVEWWNQGPHLHFWNAWQTRKNTAPNHTRTGLLVTRCSWAVVPKAPIQPIQKGLRVWCWITAKRFQRHEVSNLEVISLAY